MKSKPLDTEKLPSGETLSLFQKGERYFVTLSRSRVIRMFRSRAAARTHFVILLKESA